MPTWKLQQNLVEKIKNGGQENYLILVEHEPVYTTGIRSNVYDQALESNLKNLGADFVRSNRGGLITFHGPGQLVAYPILDLRKFMTSINLTSDKRLKLLGMKWYINTLEEVVIQTLKHGFDLHGFRSPNTGVWVGQEPQEMKICAMGVHNNDLVTCHGLALNCNTDLSWFNHIVPCGIEGKGVTSLSQELKRQVPIAEAESVLIEQFSHLFNCQVIKD